MPCTEGRELTVLKWLVSWPVLGDGRRYLLQAKMGVYYFYVNETKRQYFCIDPADSTSRITHSAVTLAPEHSVT